MRKIISYLLAVLLGFWLATAGILHGTKVGNVLDEVVRYLPSKNQVHQLFDFSKPDEGTVERKVISYPAQKNQDVNLELIEVTIIKLINELREENDLRTLVNNEMLHKGAVIRAEETAESFSHTRPNGLDANTVLKEEGIKYPYTLYGENLAMGTYYLEEEEMAEILFNGWVESEGHYENMVHPDYLEIGVGVYYDGENIYITQLFGSQL